MTRRLKFLFAILLAVSVGAGVVAPIARAAPPTGFEIETVVDGLNIPTAFDFAPDGRIFVAEKDGTVKIIKDGAVLPVPFFVVPNVNTWIDRGLIGLALDPAFATNGYVYLAYTHENNPSNFEGPKVGKIVRVTANGDVAVPGSMITLLGSVSGSAAQPSCNNFAITADCIPSDSGSHSVGGLRFGPDGKLYATLGDGAGFASVDPTAYKAQNIDWLGGKIIRINKDGTAPSDNPFYSATSSSANRSKVWAYGIRNSFRFNFHPTSGKPYFGEVGWGTFEEINVGTKGANFGWPCMEGNQPQGSYVCTAANPTNPIYQYDHLSGVAAVVGGAFMGNAYPTEYRGDYVFGDFHRSSLYKMEIGANDTAGAVSTWYDGNAGGPVAILTAPDGTIYFIAIFEGALKKLVYSSNLKPRVTFTATPTSGNPPLTVSFSSVGTNDPEGSLMTYRWTFGDGTATTTPGNVASISKQYTAEGRYTAVLRATDSAGNFGEKAIEIVVGNPPVGNANPTLESISATATSVPVGTAITFSSLVKNTGDADPVVIDFEIFDAVTGVQMYQHAATNQVIPTNTTREFSAQWVPSRSGTFRVAIGLFSKDWASVHQWYNEAMVFSVFDREPQQPLNLRTQVADMGSSTALVNTALPLSATVSNQGGDGEGVVYLVVTNETGTKMYERVFDNQFFSGAQNRTFTASYTPTQPGTYYLDVGLFADNWASMYEWKWRADTVSVVSAVTPPVALAHASTTLSNAAPVRNTNVTIGASVRNSGGPGKGVIALRVNRPDGSTVFERNFEGQTFTANQMRTFSATWIPTTAGTYYVDVGVFADNWTTMYEWKWRSATITVR
jgi:glucose/arabinose dehydrogenase